MRTIILDLDLDFFLGDFPDTRAPSGERLESAYYLPGEEQAVTHFLEAKCFLSTAAPLRGAVVKRHDDSFWAWRRLIDEGLLKQPFEIVHVDAHADLGNEFPIGPGMDYISTELLYTSLPERARPDCSKLHEGNFLLFAVACQWVSKLTYVRDPRRLTADLQSFYFKDFRSASGYLLLKRCTCEQYSEQLRRPKMDISQFEFEPEVPFEMIPAEEYQAEEPFSFVFLSCSPEYTPETADALIPIIREYIREI